MNLIQQAEQRLAELRRAGELREVKVGNGSSTLAAAGPSAPISAPPVHAALHVAPHPHAAPLHPHPTVSREPARRSARVAIDLARLERRGYLVPGAAESRIAEDFRQLRRALMSNVTRASTPGPRHEALIMVTSALPGEGKTFCSINLAMSLAMGVDTSVLLVDADALRPSVMSRLALPPARGLLDLLSGPRLDPADVLLSTNIPKLSLLPAGTASPKASELLASEALERLLQDLASRYPDRLIVLDAPPLLLTTAGPALAQRMGQVVMVVEAGKTTRESVAQAFASVETCPIVISVLNNCSPRMAARGYGYGYGASASSHERDA